MTRGQAPETEIEYRSYGRAGAERMVVVLRTGPVATVDPDPAVTGAHVVRVLAVDLEAPELENPPAFTGESPADLTIKALSALLERETDAPVGLVGERETAALAASMAARLGERVDRLVLIAPLEISEPLARDLLAAELAEVASPTLVLCGDDDAAAPPETASWYLEHLPHGALAEVSPEARGSIDARLGLVDVWDRALAHLASDVD